MRLYHGSPKNIAYLTIDPSLARHDISSLAEGYGIYLTDDLSFAKRYGPYVYHVTIDNKDITDFTKAPDIQNVIKKIEQDTNIPITNMVDLEPAIQGVLSGDVSAVHFHKEINLTLDSEEAFHAQYGHLVTDDENCLHERIKLSFLSHVNDIIKYYDKGFRTSVYICFRHAENLTITDRKKY